MVTESEKSKHDMLRAMRKHIRENGITDFTDAVLIHLVVADVVHHVFRGVALLSGIGHLIGQLLVPVL